VFADDRAEFDQKEWPVEPTRERAYRRWIAELEAEVAALKAQYADT
jgi:hypothetical protein